MLLRQVSRSRSTRVMVGLVTVLVATCSQSSAGIAQTCGSEYVLKEGDTLGSDRHTSVWRSRAMDDHSLRQSGSPRSQCVFFWFLALALKVPCLSGLQPQQPLPPIATTPAQAVTVPEAAFCTSSLVRRVELLTAEGYTPYTATFCSKGAAYSPTSSAPRCVSSKRKREDASTIAYHGSMIGPHI